MNNLIPIEHSGQRVITTELLAQVYETDTNNIKNNFNNHKGNFKEGIHYFLLRGEALRAFKREVNDIDLVAPNVNQLYLWTERGANRHCKILDTPKAWEQFDHLEETYFMVKDGRVPIAPPSADATRRITAEAKLNNSRARMSSAWLKLADRVPIPEFQQICASYACTALAGKEVLPLPDCTEHLYTATEIGTMLGGIDKAKIGHIAKVNGLKTPEYGKTVWDKSPYSNKQVESFRYNDKAMGRFRQILGLPG